MEEKNYNLELYEKLKNEGLILFEVIVGSQAYATNIETSDIDKKFVYILPEDYIYGTKYIPQIEVNKDYVGYEVKRFLELIASNNPTLLEILHSPEDCILHKDPVFDYILEHKNEFITKICADSFGGYARQQIKKAKGLDKKQNWEKNRVVRKEPIDFCYVIDGYKSVPLELWFKNNGYNSDVQKFCGVVNIPNARDLYALFFDTSASICFSVDESKESKEYFKKFYKIKHQAFGLGYKGLSKVGGSENAGISNQLRLSSVSKDEEPIAIINYNKDSYTQHCKNFLEYQEWLKNRNEARYVETQECGQKIDCKNIMHLVRLLRMSREIVETKEIVVRRQDAEYLKSIRRGEVILQDIIDWAEKEILVIDDLFLRSNLPEKIEEEFINELLLIIRRSVYNR